VVCRSSCLLGVRFVVPDFKASSGSRDRSRLQVDVGGDESDRRSMSGRRGSPGLVQTIRAVAFAALVVVSAQASFRPDFSDNGFVDAPGSGAKLEIRLAWCIWFFVEIRPLAMFDADHLMRGLVGKHIAVRPKFWMDVEAPRVG
jgi:hypothetical protein